MHSFTLRLNFQSHCTNCCFEVLLLDRQLQFLREQRKYIGDSHFLFTTFRIARGPFKLTFIANIPWAC